MLTCIFCLLAQQQHARMSNVPMFCGEHQEERQRPTTAPAEKLRGCARINQSSVFLTDSNFPSIASHEPGIRYRPRTG